MLSQEIRSSFLCINFSNVLVEHAVNVASNLSSSNGGGGCGFPTTTKGFLLLVSERCQAAP